MYQSEKIDAIALALSKAQSQISKAEKSSTNPMFKSKYADLDSVFTQCKGPLNENGICISQTMGYAENGELCLMTQLTHESGQWIRSMLPIKYDHILGSPDKINALQRLGSTITYLKRYGLSAIVGCGGEEDDDGNKGVISYQAPEVAVVEKALEQQNLVDTIKKQFEVLMLGCSDQEKEIRLKYFSHLKTEYGVTPLLLTMLGQYVGDDKKLGKALDLWEKEMIAKNAAQA